MSLAPNIESDRNSVLLAFTAQLNDLMTQIQTELKKANPVDPVVRAADDLHPLEMQILQLVAPGVAMTPTQLAKATGVARSAVHYHVKRLVLKNKVREISANLRNHKVFYVAPIDLVKIPGVDV